MDRYLGLPGETAQVLVEGWLDTGDLGFVHAGDLFVVGRAKDVLIVRGRNHAPETVEDCIDGVAGVRRGCVVAVSGAGDPGGDSASGTERLWVFLEWARDEAGAGVLLEDEVATRIEADCRQRVLATTGLAVDQFVLLSPGTLPRTSSGKLKRRETLGRYQAGTLRPPASTSPLRMASAMWRSHRALRRVSAKRVLAKEPKADD